MEYMSLKMLPKKKFWNIRKILTYRVQNPIKKIEIDEHFVSYYSVLLFWNFNLSLNQKGCLIDCGIFVSFPLWNILHTSVPIFEHVLQLLW